jgi:hypothetical protein
MSSSKTGFFLLEKSVLHSIQQLKPTFREVLAVNYGLDEQVPVQSPGGNAGTGLDEAQQDMLKTKALRKLRHPMLAEPIISAFDACTEEIWQALADPFGVVFMNEVTVLGAKRLPPAIQIALDLRFSSLSIWLSAYAEKTPVGWHRSRYSFAEIEQAIASLAKCADEWRLPRPFTWVVKSAEIAPDLLFLAIAFSTQFKNGRHFTLYLDYVIESPLSSQPLRGIRLHRQLCEEYRDTAVPISLLLNRYKALYSDDNDICESSDILVMMRNTPHLFLILAHDQLAGVHAAEEASPPQEVAYVSRLQIGQSYAQHFRKTGKSSDTATAMVRDLLHQHGPMPTAELIKKLEEISEGKYYNIHLHSTFNYSGEITQLSPNVYGLANTSYCVEDTPNLADHLLNNEDCLCYVNARVSGEPMGLFPLWTHAMEHRWCQWAKCSATPRLYEGLLHVAEPEHWPIPDAEKREWAEISRSLGRYHLYGTQRYPIPEKSEPLTQLLRGAIAAKQGHGLSWIRLNIACRRKSPITTGGGTTFALLVVLGALEVPRHWSLHHPPGPNLTELLDKLSETRFLNGTLSWNSALGREIVERIRRVAAAPPIELAARVDMVRLVARSEKWILDDNENPDGELDEGSSEDGNGVSSETTISEQQEVEQLSLDF